MNWRTVIMFPAGILSAELVYRTLGENVLAKIGPRVRVSRGS